jgi:hypothetical protein
MVINTASISCLAGAFTRTRIIHAGEPRMCILADADADADAAVNAREFATAVIVGAVGGMDRCLR